MPENENLGDEKLLILPLGDESKKITQVISNDTARRIIELLADAPLSASDISERLHAPLTTITYNLENLESVGLVKVERIKYSEKGREVKIYAPVRKLIVVVPEKTDRKSVADVLRKYLGVITAAVFASVFIEFFMRSAGRSITEKAGYKLAEVPAPTPMPTAAQSPSVVLNETIRGGDIASGVPAPTAPPMSTAGVESVQSTAMPSPIPTATPAASQGAPDILTGIADAISAHPGIAFLLGCLFVVVVLVIMDYRRKRMNG